MFGRHLKSKYIDKNKRKYISTKEYIEYFGDFKDLKYVCKKEELEKEY